MEQEATSHSTSDRAEFLFIEDNFIYLFLFKYPLVKEFWSDLSKFLASKSNLGIDLTMCDIFSYFFIIVNITEYVGNVLILLAK